MAKPRGAGGIGVGNLGKKPNSAPKTPKTPEPKLPPFLSYDPSIGAEMRSLGRGLKDILADTRRARKYARVDWRTQRQDIGRERGRGLHDINLDLSNELRDIGFQREDLNTQAQRGREDFATQLTGLIRNFQTQGREQMQAANAAGVLPGGSAARAAAARRQENLAIARQPIDTGLARLEQDTARSMGRLGVAESDVRTAADTATSRLLEDAQREFMLGRRDFRRTKLDLRDKRQRARREYVAGKLDLINQAIFDARQRKPGAFTQYGSPKNKPKKK